MPSPALSTIGVLCSGGLDSAILTAHLASQNRRVQPIYVACGLAWQEAELAAARKFLAALDSPQIVPLEVFELPLADLYGPHWSITGKQVPDATSPDEAVFLPGRNLLLAIKPALWCQLHGIGELALGILDTNPFDDASPAFFAAFEATLQHTGPQPVKIVRPLASLHKSEVMRIGRDLPLELTFSCIAPVGNRHCGRCNKCAERKAAFHDARMVDKTVYDVKHQV